MADVALKRPPTRRERLVQVIVVIGIIGLSGFFLQKIFDRTSQSAPKPTQDDNGCLGIGS